ncbi:hypothetical protein BN903_342 [Halorubrum sp. AJ67]|nr:hypothetical protein BN903_342 [Halorubrum sp. AJ67]
MTTLLAVLSSAMSPGGLYGLHDGPQRDGFAVGSTPCGSETEFA